MTKDYIRVQIRNGKRSTFFAKTYLKEHGFHFVKKSDTNVYWEKQIPIDNFEESEELQSFCKKNGLQIQLVENKFIRGNKYRKEFFEHNKPVFKNYYFCIYCGFLIPKEKVQVDHIIPVKAATDSKYIQKKLTKMHLSGVNDVKNLGASCKNCNLKKGKKIGLWIWRGYIGKSNKFQKIRWILRILIAIALLIFIYICY